MRNIEAKYRCRNLDPVRDRALALGAREAGVLAQRDLFFAAPEGRLKLREFGDGTGELIAYRRADAAEARESDYRIARTDNPGALASALEHAFGVVGEVRKRRNLLLYRHTRIHLDRVEHLGTFVELETVVTDQSDAEAHAELALVAGALGLRNEDRVSVAYVDLLQQGIGGDGGEVDPVA